MDSNTDRNNIPLAPPGPAYVIHRRFHNINGQKLKVLNSHPLRQPYVYEVPRWTGYRPRPK